MIINFNTYNGLAGDSHLLLIAGRDEESAKKDCEESGASYQKVTLYL